MCLIEPDRPVAADHECPLARGQFNGNGPADLRHVHRHRLDRQRDHVHEPGREHDAQQFAIAKGAEAGRLDGDFVVVDRQIPHSGIDALE
jgi:hypothetical protein